MKLLRLPPSPEFEVLRGTTTLINQETPTSVLPQKRKLVATDLEIPDSEGEDDEDYGWADEDEQELPPPPPQWQGSEDILIPPVGRYEAEEEEPEEEPEDEQNDGAPSPEDTKFHRTHKSLPKEIEDSEDELA